MDPLEKGTKAGSGGSIRAQGLVKDLTERKRAEEALRQSEQRYRDFISHSNEGVWRLELEQPIPMDLPSEEILERFLQYAYIAECNLAHARNSGFSTPEEVVGKHLRDLVSPLDQGRLESFRSSVRTGWQSGTVEFRTLDKAGNSKHFLRTQIPIIENGMLVRAWGITRNVTELKRAEVALRESEEHFRRFIENVPLGVYRTTPDGRVLKTNSTLDLIDRTIQSVRRISTELRPPILDDLGLVAAVEWAGEDFEARTKTKCRMDLPPEDIFIDPERATALFRILQETLTNIARHVSATQVNIRLAKEWGGLNLEVHDNGKGVSEEQLSAARSLGILGMRERALLLGGELIISGVPGQGTLVSVRIPEARQN